MCVDMHTYGTKKKLGRSPGCSTNLGNIENDGKDAVALETWLVEGPLILRN